MKLVEMCRPGHSPDVPSISENRLNKEVIQGGAGTEVIITLDAIALYPSIEKKVAMEICKQAAAETKVKVQHMNLLEATRFLMLMWTKEEVEGSSIKKYLPTRRVTPGKRTGKLGLTTSNSLSAAPNDQSQWVWPKVKITDKVRREIFSLVVEQLVRLFCDTQTYTWRGRFYVQRKGLPIGPRATSAIARVVMNFLDSRLLTEVDDRNHIVCKVY